MMHWLRKYKNAILITVVAGFVISTFVGFGLYLTQGSSNPGTVLEVNDEEVPYARYLTLYNRVVENYREKNRDLSPESLNQIKQEVIQSLVREAVFFQEAKRYGIQVSDAELAQALAQIPAFKKEGRFDVGAYAQALRFALKTTPEEFEETQRRQIAIQRLQAFVQQGIKVTDRELDLEYRAARKLPPGVLPPKLQQAYEKERDEFRGKLIQEKGAEILNRWYQQLGTNLKVKSHLEELERRRGS